MNPHAFDLVPLERRATVIESFSNAPEQIREVIDTYWLLLDKVRDTGRYYNMETHRFEKRCSCYISGKNGRFIEMDGQKSDAEYGIVFRHEYGHYIDDVIGGYSESKAFDEAFQMDKASFNNSKDKGIANLKKCYRTYQKIILHLNLDIFPTFYLHLQQMVHLLIQKL